MQLGNYKKRKLKYGTVNIPPDIRKLSKHNFTKKVQEVLLKVLSLEDTYVDVSTLISKLLQYS